MNSLLTNKKAIAVFILPALILFVIVVYFSIVMTFYYSLLDWDGIGKAAFIGFSNYIKLFVQNKDGFIKSVWNSITLAILTIFIQLPLALFFAMVLARKSRGTSFFRTVYFIPVTISTTVIGQLWMKIYHPSYGVVNTVLEMLGLDSWTRPWLGDPKTALMAAFVPIIWQYIGYHMLLLYTAIKSMPGDIYEAAIVDGASETNIAFRITIPMLKPYLKTCLVFAAIGSLKVFDLIYVLTNGGPAHATEVPSTLMFHTVFFKNRYGYGSAMAMFIFIECLVFTLLIQRLMKNNDMN